MSDSGSQQRSPSDVAAGVLIPASWEVPAVFRKRLGNQAGRQRAMVSDGHLLLILHSPPLADENERVGRLFWRQPDGTWKANCPRSTIKTLQGHLKEFRIRIDELERQEDEAKTSNDYFKVISDLLPLYRSARNQYQALQAARQEIQDARDVIDLRDEAYEIERTAELLNADAKNALDFLIVCRAEEQAQVSYHIGVSSHRLNVLVAFFFPIATLSSIFGTNLLHGYEQRNSPWLFLGMLATGLLFGLLLMLIITGKHERKS
ncbi:MAG: hypothetical protein O3B13_08125 [Planctomycetota bacterium]|nr:hypothetical protein [Planctomycetota bacterium]MDA1163053.1 hypothetical protein [Planctomycetota bacterium]